jgi:endo-1,4-beta-xylanase
LLIGVAVRPDMLWDERYASILQLEFNLLEPENAMKWQTLRRHEERFDFNEADALVAFAQAHGHKIRGHVLAWHLSNPPWLSHRGYSALQMSSLLREHVAIVMQRYSGRVFAWDVVNEAIEKEDGTPCSSIWYDQPGIGFAGEGTRYIEEIFRWARESDPSALLFYNDNAFGIDRKIQRVCDLIGVLSVDAVERQFGKSRRLGLIEVGSGHETSR